MLDAVKRAPYYDDYEEQGKLKQYTQLLAVPGRVAQAREITQIQSTVKDIIKNIGDSIFKDGNIIEGCQVSTRTRTDGAKIAEVSAGKVYLSGMVLPVAAATVEITGIGRETIGVKLVEEIITHEDDNSLRDPAQSYANYQLPGCDRLRSYVEVVANDSSASTITTLLDGQIAVERYAAEYGVLNQTLARRTHDESGSYVVHGLRVGAESDARNLDSFTVVVEAGKAYVLGYELGIPAPRRLRLPRSLNTTTISSGAVYTEGSYTTLSSVPYISDIISVVGRREKSIRQTIYQAGPQEVVFTEDPYSVVSIDYVSQGDTIFTPGVDYRLSTTTDGANRYCLEWLSSNYPVSGSPYTVGYTYEHTFVKDQDYKLYVDSSGSQSINWINTEVVDGTTVVFAPIENTPMSITYSLYLARKDIIYLDQNGNIDAVLGTPAVYGSEVLPEAPVNTLPLAYIMSPPSGSITQDINLKIAVSNIGLTRFTMSDIQRLLDRIRTIEYDQAVLTLNEESKMYITPNAKKGIWVDPLIDLSRIDFHYDLVNSLGQRFKYDAAIDLDSNICYLPVKSHTYDAGYDESLGRTATLDKVGDPVEVISQNNATKTFQVNPYSVFPQLPEITIDPAVDVWIEDSFIEIPISMNSSEIVSSSTRHISSQQVINSGSDSSITTTSHVDTVVNNRVSTSVKESVISSKAVTYIRERTINVSGSNFYPGLDNIRCYFDGIELPLTPTGESESGSAPGTIKANSRGSFTASFTIPKNRVLTGIREVRLEADSIPDEYYEKYAIALYQASGTSRSIQRTVTTLTTVLLNRVTTVETTTYVDPVGQTFVLDRMTMVSGINLYFASAPSDPNAASVTCDIREVVNGTITSTILGHKTLSAAEVYASRSSDSSRPTTFLFDDPVLLEGNKEYAFVVRSTSPDYWLWVAELGEHDVLSGETVLYNPYLIGVMMSSSNNSSWTNHQTTDIKFQLLSSNYAESTTVQFDNIQAIEEFSRVYLLAESIIPTGTSISWEYSLDSGRTYSPISPYSLTHFSQLNTSISFRATLRRTENTNLSPVLALDSVGATLSCYDNADSSYYVGREVSNLSSFNTVDVVLDTFLPEGTAIKVYAANNLSSDPSIAVERESANLDYGWKEKIYHVQFRENATTCRIIIKLESNHAYSTPSFRRLRAIMS